MPRGRKPKSAVYGIKSPSEIDAEIAAVMSQITELKKKLSALKKERVVALAAQEQEELKLLAEKIRTSGKSIEDWLKEIG
jgi:hypothetical protein